MIRASAGGFPGRLVHVLRAEIMMPNDSPRNRTMGEWACGGSGWAPVPTDNKVTCSACKTWLREHPAEAAKEVAT